MVAHVIIVLAQSKELSFGFFRLGLTFEDLGPVGTGDWGLGDLDSDLTIDIQ